MTLKIKSRACDEHGRDFAVCSCREALQSLRFYSISKTGRTHEDLGEPETSRGYKMSSTSNGNAIAALIMPEHITPDRDWCAT